MPNSQQTPPVTQQPKKPIPGRKWTLVAFFLTVVGAVVNGNNTIPVIDRLIVGALLAFAASVLVAVILGIWNRYTAKMRKQRT